MATAAAPLAASPIAAPPRSLGEPRPEARAAIRDLLTSAAAYQSLDPETRRTIASSLVRISSTALALADEGGPGIGEPDELPPPPASALAAEFPLARAQTAGDKFSGVSASRVGDTTKQILNAVSFPRFVNELITGVFKALHESNQQQMASFVELIKNVSTTIDGFADANLGDAGARTWLAERFPGSFVVSGDSDDGGFDNPAEMTPEERKEWQAERDASTKLRLKPNAVMPSEAALKTALGLGPQDSVPSGDPENLVGFARSALARQRQQVLSSMVMMGLQRLVVDSGRLNASMRFHIDTRSAAAQDTGSMFDVRNESEASGKLGVGPWGMEAKVKNTIGYVSTEQTQTTEEMNTSVDLNSSVELIFHTDYVPLSRLAGVGDIDRIRVNSLNPAEELRIGSEEAKARIAAQRQSEAGRESALSQRLQRPAPPQTPPAPSSKPDAKEPAKGGAKDGAKEPAKEGAKEPAKEGAKEPAKEGAKEPAKDAAKQPSKTPPKAPAKQPAPPPPKK